jgi:4-hydroxy-4-methyl-2-oxoglutarate aldolase
VTEQTILPGHNTPGVFEDLPAAVRDALTTAMVSDSLDAEGLRDQVMLREVEPLVLGNRLAGRAHPVQFVVSDIDPQDPYGDAIDFIDSLPFGAAAVIATGGDARTAYWGELFSAAAIGRGAAGTVCDGPVRDTPKVRALGYPVWAAGSRPIDFRARMRITPGLDAVVCAGVTVARGDLVFADDDGVVVIPARAEHAVLDRAVSRATAEKTVLAELMAGSGLRDVWERWKVL